MIAYTCLASQGYILAYFGSGQSVKTLDIQTQFLKVITYNCVANTAWYGQLCGIHA